MSEQKIHAEEAKLESLLYNISYSAIEAREALFSDYLKNIKDAWPQVYINSVKNCCLALAFFPDQQVKTKLKELGFRNDELDWFIDLNDIILALREIRETKQIIVYPHSALSIIKEYLEAKILATTLHWCKRKFKKDYLNLVKNFFRQKRYHDSLNQSDNMKHPLSNMYEAIAKQISDQSTFKDTMEKMNKGKINSIYIPLLIDCFQPKKIPTKSGKLRKMSENEFLWRLFDLIKLIMKDKAFVTDDEYFIRDGYSHNYRHYVARTIKKIGIRNSSFRDYNQD